MISLNIANTYAMKHSVKRFLKSFEFFFREEKSPQKSCINIVANQRLRDKSHSNGLRNDIKIINEHSLCCSD